MTIRADQEEESKLHVGARLDNLKLVRAAIKEGSDPDALGINGRTALHEASSCGNLEITIALLEGGADPNIQDSLRCTPLHLAAINGHLEVVRSLVRAGTRLDLKNAEGKIPQSCASDDCLDFLARQRAEEFITVRPSPVEENSVRKLYGPKASQSPVLKKHRQSSPWSDSSQSSRESMTSSSSGSSDSCCESSYAVYQPGPGEVKVSLDFSPNRRFLDIHVGEIKDVKLPAGHNMSHIYVKGYLVPDKSKDSKRKTGLRKLGRSEERRTSRDSVTLWDNEEAESDKTTGKRMGQRLVSSLKRGSRSSLHREKSRDQSKPAPVYRISTTFGENFHYNADELRRVNVETCNVLLTICGRNRVTTRAQPIACLTLPLAGYAKMVKPDWYPLAYKILLPSGYDVAEERESFRGSRSWEQKGGKFTGRSLAWNGASKAMSMPNIDVSVAASQMSDGNFIQRGEDGFPPSGSKKQTKHSKPGKLLKKEFKILKGRGNHRYRNNSSSQELGKEERADDSFMVNIAERSSTIPGASRGGIDLNKSLSGSRRRSTASNIGLHEYPVSRDYPNDSTEIISLDEEEERASKPELEHRSSFARSLKYSRAFQQQASAARRREAAGNDIDVEDFEETSDTPFAVSNFHGQKRGIACN